MLLQLLEDYYFVVVETYSVTVTLLLEFNQYNPIGHKLDI